MRKSWICAKPFFVQCLCIYCKNTRNAYLGCILFIFLTERESRVSYPPTVLIRFPKRLPCADNVRSINGLGLIERDLVGSATTVFTPESKEFKHREPTANFDYVLGKRWDPYTPSQTRFSIALECNSSKVEATVAQIRLLYMHFF